MNIRRVDSDRRKQKIVAAATAVFARKGLNGARIDDIAQELGMSKGAVYLYFESKDDIITATMKHLFRQEVDTLYALLAAEDTVAARLRRLVRQAMIEVQKLANHLSISLEFHAVATRDDNVRQFLKTYFQQYRLLLTDLVKQGVEKGEFRDVEAAETAVIIIAMIEGFILLWALDPESVNLEEQGETAVCLLLDGLQAR